MYPCDVAIDFNFVNWKYINKYCNESNFNTYSTIVVQRKYYYNYSKSSFVVPTK